MATPKENFQFFLDNKKEIVEKYGGMYVVISDLEVKKSFEEERTAYYYGVENYGLGNFIVQLCTETGYTAIYHSRVRINNARL